MMMLRTTTTVEMIATMIAEVLVATMNSWFAVHCVIHLLVMNYRLLRVVCKLTKMFTGAIGLFRVVGMQ